MTRIAPALLRDELLELLSERPDLVAVADAVAATHARPRRARRGAVAAAAGLAAALVVAFWQGGSSPNFAERAEAAIGAGPVLQVVVEAPGETTVVDLASGAERRLRVRLEYRYDAERRRLRTSVTQGGRVTHDVLQPRPELDPALLGFVSGYREALATQRPVEGVVGGRRVLWLAFGTGASRERVAIDSRTLTPLLIQSLVGARTTWRVREIRARERRASDFARSPSRTLTPTAGSVVSSRRVSVLPAPWLRVRAIRGVKLVSAEVQQLVRGYARHARPQEPGVGAQLRYRGSSGFVEVQQAPRAEPAYAYLGEATFSGAALPPAGRVVLMELRSTSGRSDWIAQLRAGAMFVTISATSRSLALAAARAIDSRPRKGS